MENIISLCESFFDKYNKFINKTGIEIEYSKRLSDLEFEIADGIEFNYYDYDNNRIFVSRKLMDNENFEFYFYKTLLDVLTTKKEDKITYKGISYSNENNTKNFAFNDMISNYICNSITCVDINDINRVYISKVEKIINSDELVKIYFNNDISKLVSYFEELDVNFDLLSKNLDMLYKYNLTDKNISSDIGTNIDRMLIDAVIKKYIKENKEVIEYSDIEITSGLTLGYAGFENISDNKLYYYNNFKNMVSNNNAKSL